MKKLIISLLVVLLSTIILADGVQPLGNGTSENPYQIESLDNLLWVSTNPYHWNKFYVQTADIDASATQQWNSGGGFIPIGNNVHWFVGSYDGQGHTISNLFIYTQTTDYVGFFGEIRDASISNLNLVNANVQGFLHVGILCGDLTGSEVSNVFCSGTVTGGNCGLLASTIKYSQIDSCSTSGSVYGSNYVGGFAGRATLSEISNSHSTINLINSASYCGGFIGAISSSDITTCYATGSVEAYDKVGGFAGIVSSSFELNNCFSECSVEGSSETGGFVGLSSRSNIANCYSTGDVNSDLHVGGFVGQTYEGLINECYSTGDVSGYSIVGGFVGTQSQIIDSDYFSVLNSYSTGDITCPDGLCGGFEGEFSYGVMNNCHYNADVVLINGESLFSQGGLTDQLYTDWINNGLVLDADNYYQAADDIYLISSMTDFTNLLAFGQEGLSFRLELDLDLTNHQGFYIPYLQSNIDGNGFTVSNLSFDTENDYTGMFGVTDNCIISNLGITNATVSGHNSVGILTGYSINTQIHCCYTSGVVSGTDNTGGIAGSIGSGSEMSNCYSRATLNTSFGSGGLIGAISSSTLSNSYFSGTLSMFSQGLCGSTDDSSLVENSFWDTDAGSATSGSGGLTQAEMRDIDTYLNAGWDFVNETANGTDDYWAIETNINDGFPHLVYQPVVRPLEHEEDELVNTFDNYPNPFNPTTTIRLSMAKEAYAEISIFNIKGQRIKTLINDVLPAGEHSVVWSGNNDNGVKVASGIYFYKLQAGTYIKTKKMILMK